MPEFVRKRWIDEKIRTRAAAAAGDGAGDASATGAAGEQQQPAGQQRAEGSARAPGSGTSSRWDGDADAAEDADLSAYDSVDLDLHVGGGAEEEELRPALDVQAVLAELRRPAASSAASAGEGDGSNSDGGGDSNSKAVSITQAIGMETAWLEGVVESIRFHAPDSGYTAFDVRVQRCMEKAWYDQEVITATGTFPFLSVGQTLIMAGWWRTHARYGAQFKVERWEETRPADLTGLERYLASGLIKGIGPRTARRIVQKLGMDTMRAIEEEPRLLERVEGIGRKKAEQISETWKAQRGVKDVMQFLLRHGVGVGTAVRIYKAYTTSEDPGPAGAEPGARVAKAGHRDVISVICENPYRLAEEVRGVGFQTADAIARSLGVPLSSPYRYRAAITHALRKAAETDGHCYLPLSELLKATEKILSVAADAPPAPPQDTDEAELEPGSPEAPPPLEEEYVPGARDVAFSPNPVDLRRALARMQKASEIKAVDARLVRAAAELPPGTSPKEAAAPEGPPSDDDTLLYMPAFYRAEVGLASKLQGLLSHRAGAAPAQRTQEWLRGYEERARLELSEQQREAVRQAATESVLIVTGGPGCGKTFTTRVIVSLWQSMGLRVALAAPTGRAAQRLGELSGDEAKTIHRLLEYDPRHRRFRRTDFEPLDFDAVVVDESSMVDLFLANALLRACAAGTRLLLVGDVDQLPSVGPGRVFGELCDSRLLPVVRLTHIFRQAERSRIVTSAHAINRGELPALDALPRGAGAAAGLPSDCVWRDEEDGARIIEALQELCLRTLPALDFEPRRDFQVLAPTVKGPLGVRNLNTVIQETLNPARPFLGELTFAGTTFRVGDRVIHTVNDYDKEVFNGDMGVVDGILSDANGNQIVTVRYPSVTSDQRSKHGAERLVEYEAGDLDELQLAWAISIHKSQGSEYPAVGLILHPSHYILLTRNLFYTALTRARELALLLGPSRALETAVRRTTDRRRFTLLADRLRATGLLPERPFDVHSSPGSAARAFAAAGGWDASKAGAPSAAPGPAPPQEDAARLAATVPGATFVPAPAPAPAPPRPRPVPAPAAPRPAPAPKHKAPAPPIEADPKYMRMRWVAKKPDADTPWTRTAKAREGGVTDEGTLDAILSGAPVDDSLLEAEGGTDPLDLGAGPDAALVEGGPAGPDGPEAPGVEDFPPDVDAPGEAEVGLPPIDPLDLGAEGGTGAGALDELDEPPF
eukprot:tig00020943_g16294.t1